MIERKINVICEDYILHLQDLKNLEIEYDKATGKAFASFDRIFIQGIEQYVILDIIIGNFINSYRLNAYYENLSYKSHQVTIGEDIINYLKEWEKKYFEERGGINE